MTRNHAIDRLRALKAGSYTLEAAEQVARSRPRPRGHRDYQLGRPPHRRLHGRADARTREAVRLAYVEGESYLELSERYSVPLNTMRSWLRRSLIQLRNCLSP